MILNISFRTDIVSCYPEWLADTLLNKEFIGSRNPYNNVVQLFPTKDIEGIIFCSKDYSKLIPYLGKIDNKYHCLYHYTITPYGNDIEPNVPLQAESWSTLMKMSEIVGKHKIIWRYDPILLYGDYTKDFHVAYFNLHSYHYRDYFKLCTFNFVNIYDKVRKKFPDLEPVSKINKEEIATKLGKIALKNDIYLQTCILDKDYSGIHNEGCITPKTIGLNITPVKAPLQNDCMCTVHTYGIGDYNTCTNGCKYCYATSFVSKEKNIMDSYLPLGTIKKGDKIITINKRVVNNEPDLFRTN